MIFYAYCEPMIIVRGAYYTVTNQQRPMRNTFGTLHTTFNTTTHYAPLIHYTPSTTRHAPHHPLHTTHPTIRNTPRITSSATHFTTLHTSHRTTHSIPHYTPHYKPHYTHHTILHTTTTQSTCPTTNLAHTLQSIRDQMATGLSRLRELEAEVRNIPHLQVRLRLCSTYYVLVIIQSQ